MLTVPALAPHDDGGHQCRPYGAIRRVLLHLRGFRHMPRRVADRNCKAPTPSCAGFSLLEVLIAFAVMAAVLGALFPGQAAMVARTGEAAERLLAADTALSHLDALGVAEPVPAEAETDYRGWKIDIAFE